MPIEEHKYYKVKRTIRRFGDTSLVISPREDLRSMLDRMIDGKPVNTSVTKHEPLPPDSEIDDDNFDTGTREILDLVDAQVLSDDIAAVSESETAKALNAKKEAEDKRFEDAVRAEVERLKQTSEQQELH